VKGIDRSALDILLRYDFPGNVRELENIIERAVALTEQERIQNEDLPPDLLRLEVRILAGEDLESLEEMEKRHIAKALEKASYNKNLAAKILDVPRTTLWRRLRKYGIDR
jgi:two-component system response regulator AtoC